jgi:sulfite reductase (NADPH) flavoprotein alpha-component
MNSPLRMQSLIPESAPFSPEQRIWLNGLFSGLLSIEGDITSLGPADSQALMPTAAPDPDTEDDDAPWHDQTLPLAERMQLARERPLRRRMMAAMAQQDCGQCGYNCQDYADALFARQEERLNLCVPGGKDTARMLKVLNQELESPLSPPPPPSPLRSAPLTVEPATERPGTSRDNPVLATFLSRTRLNRIGSEKETWHVEFNLRECGLDYTVGDSFGIYPRNDPGLVTAVLQALKAPADFPIGERSLGDVLTSDVSLAPAPDALFQLISYISGGERRQKAKALASGDDPDRDAASLDVLAAIQKFAGVRPDPEAFAEALEPLQPRLYSISSSPKAYPGRLSLTVDAVRYQIGERVRLGAASTYLAERAAPGNRLKVYVQKAHAFRLPEDPAVPIIMIGPGTGVAPFRAFLQERMATKAPGRNWLFFGHQRRNFDFLYEDEFAAMKSKGILTRLSLAWSRDSGQKIYVQDRMREVGGDLWAWLADGAHVYVCGDATRMAKDVERALVDIVAEFGARSADEAIAFVTQLKKQGRYQQDVY